MDVPTLVQAVNGSKGLVPADQPLSSFLTRLMSLADTVVRPSSRRVRVDGLCSSRCRRLAFWRRIFPVPVRRNRFEAPLWVLALGMFPLLLVLSRTGWYWLVLVGGRSVGGRVGVGRRIGIRCRAGLWSFRVARPGAGLRAAVRCQHHRHVAAVLLGGRFDESVVGDVRTQALQQSVAQFGPRLLTSAKHDGDLDLRSRLQEADYVALLGLVVVIVDFWSQLLFFDDGLLLVPAGFARLLRRLVFELAVVHDFADRRSGVRGNFDEVEIGVRGDAQCVLDAHYAYLLSPGADQSDFRSADALVDAGLSADGASLVGLLWFSNSGLSGGKPHQQQKSPAQAGPNADRSRLGTMPAARAARGTGIHDARDRTAQP